MDDKLCFVQFPHQGEEHGQDVPGWKGWNRGGHKRKFLRRTGKYVVGAKVEVGEVLFWGEWEPESRVQRIENPVPHGPRFIHDPYYVVPESYECLENTDPFVFGEQFHYGVCKQPTFRQLSYLLPGSIIVFGSCKDNEFVLDTLFVVGNRWIDHSTLEDLAGGVSREYKEVTVFPWYENLAKSEACAGASSQTCRLYFGASRDNPVHGMYSFFPCCPYEVNSEGFARPKIEIPQVVNPKKCTGVKYQIDLGLNEMKLLWDEIAEQVKRQGRALGVCAKMPERRIADTKPLAESQRIQTLAGPSSKCSA